MGFKKLFRFAACYTRSNVYEAEYQAAIDIVAEVCGMTRSAQERIVSAGESIAKDDRSPVTVADLAGQVIVSHRLRELFADDPLLAEENSDALAESTFMAQRVIALAQMAVPDLNVMSMIDALDRGNHQGGGTGRYWVLDPIDGTKGFLRGEQYAVALALVDGGEVVLGVLGCPNLEPLPSDGNDGSGRLFAALRSHGATSLSLNRDRQQAIAVDRITDPSQAVVCESVVAAHAAHSVQGKIAARLGITAEPYRIDSQCKYAVVARGQASIYLRLPRDTSYREKVWDHAAGLIVVEEAGGRVSDLHGKPLDFSQGRHLGHGSGIVCTNGVLHDQVLEACRAELGLD